MRIQIELKAECFPMVYQFLIMSLLKKCFEISDSNHLRDLYRYEEKHSNKKAKDFSSAVFFSKYKIKENQFLIAPTGKIYLTFSTNNYRTLLLVQNGLANLKTFQYQNYQIEIGRMSLLKESLPKTGHAVFRTASPICVKNKKNEYLSIEDPTYQDHLNYICNRIMESSCNRLLYRPLLMKPLLMKKRIIQFKHASFEKLNAKSTLYVPAYTGEFILEGHPDDLIQLTQLGVGNRRGSSMGCIVHIADTKGGE